MEGLPADYGAASIHAYFSDWAEAGFFKRMWQEGLMTCDELWGLGWEWQSVEGMGYEAHIRPRGEEKREKEKNPGFKARRRVVEVCHSWLKRFRKLLVRYEKKERNYRALVEFACAVIIWRHLIPIHPGLISG
jgi:transposase